MTLVPEASELWKDGKYGPFRKDLLEALEASTYATPDAIGGFPQTSGLVWKINTAKAYDQGDLYTVGGKETTYYAPKSISRVTIETVNGEPFDPAKTYAVVTNNFCAAGGDTYAVFNRAYAEGSGFNTGIPMDEAVMDYEERFDHVRLQSLAVTDEEMAEAGRLGSPELKAALDRLGVYHRYNTSLYYKGTIARGQLTGDLICVGGMDPMFDRGDMKAMAKAVRLTPLPGLLPRAF